MSGGSYQYQYRNIEDTYVDEVFDEEINLMIKDLCILLKDLEWWQSGDTGEDDYRNSVRLFKARWFGVRDERLKEIVESRIDNLRKELLETIQ